LVNTSLLPHLRGESYPQFELDLVIQICFGRKYLKREKDPSRPLIDKKKKIGRELVKEPVRLVHTSLLPQLRGESYPQFELDLVIQICFWDETS
jgi:hypothetical protein